MNYFIKTLFGPTVYSIPSLQHNGQSMLYQANFMERFGNGGISCLKLALSVLKVTCIFWIPIAIRKARSIDNIMMLVKCVTGIFLTYWTFKLVRGIGRFINPEYSQFMKVLDKANQASSTESLELLHKYEFEFSHWPSTYKLEESTISKRPRKDTPLSKNHPSSHILWNFVSYVLANTIGVYMTYPGCTSIFNTLMEGPIRQSRQKLRESHSIQRVKLVSRDQNEIEAFYFDGRESRTTNGHILVICCEGNAGYPELGCGPIPLGLNYSVIGWNHPGFAGSTGYPFPLAEQNAMEVVMEFALNNLKFPRNQIVLFAWSIGGYTASWAASNYPGIKGLIMDACFDDIEALSEKALPAFCYPIVIRTVRLYFNLNNVGHLENYNGPLRIIRRTRDEIISTGPIVSLATNRGNYLLKQVFLRRYPHLTSSKECLQIMDEYLEGSPGDLEFLMQSFDVNEKDCEKLLNDIQTSSYPSMIGKELPEEQKIKLLLYLLRQHLTDFEATHCQPLPPEKFILPWSEKPK